jgi:hypothetical protein
MAVLSDGTTHAQASTSLIPSDRYWGNCARHMPRTTRANDSGGRVSGAIMVDDAMRDMHIYPDKALGVQLSGTQG